MISMSWKIRFQSDGRRGGMSRGEWGELRIADCLPSVGPAKEGGFPPSLKLRRTGRIADFEQKATKVTKRGGPLPSLSSFPSVDSYSFDCGLRIAGFEQEETEETENGRVGKSLLSLFSPVPVFSFPRYSQFKIPRPARQWRAEYLRMTCQIASASGACSSSWRNSLR